ncbi:MAG: TIGR02281 family clan AA aspartic protease [Thiopseudomonas sp.]|nr:TIGR02281 family clan AA aspartic protease [Thiopseudomonas sp.]MCK9466422.1 TIGR02281 family clan AA aspartic protease [Thiopseudomonas sp.]
MLRWCFLVLLGLSCSLSAAPQVRVVGLFPNAAVLSIDGERKLVKVGQTGPQGVQVVRADSQSAVLRINGVESTYTLTREYASGGYTAPGKQSHVLPRGEGGHYRTSGLVNGRSMTFLVDTGATSIAFSEVHAQRLGIAYRQQGEPMTASTASGLTKAWRIKLNSVKIAGIEILGVEAAVLEGEFPREALLGMSFLNRIRWREEQGTLVLESVH